MLSIRGLETGYGKVGILRGVDLTVAEGAIVALLGGNGTGKSTLLKCVSGLLPAWSGSVEFDGRPISGLAPDRIVRLGLVQVTQSKDCVPAMTVEENLRLGAYTRRDRAGIAADLDKVLRPLPGARGVPLAARGDPERRRGPDAGARPRSHGPARR